MRGGGSTLQTRKFPAPELVFGGIETFVWAKKHIKKHEAPNDLIARGMALVR